MLFIGNIILRNVFLDSFEEGVDRYSATGKSICLLGDLNINTLRAQTCNCTQPFLDCLQSYSLFATIDKPKRVYNNSTTLTDNKPILHLSIFSWLKQLSLSKLVFKTTQNTLSRDSYGISPDYIGNLFFLGAMSISYSLLPITSWIK